MNRIANFKNVVALIFLTFVVSSSSFGIARQNDPEVFSFDEVATFEVQIKDPQKSAVSFYRMTNGSMREVKELNPRQRRYRFLLPKGKYVVKDENKVLYPLVVGHRQQQRIGEKFAPICLTIADCPEPDKSWAWIPAGPALIGDELGVGAEDERPVRTKYISAFWLQKHEVTNQQYAEFLSAQEEFDPSWIDLESRQCRIQRSETTEAVYTTDAPLLPVVMISLRGAEAYCQWLTAETGRVHRLPVEAEWEKAARGPRSSVYSYGNIYRQAAANQESGTIKKVSQYRPNGYGLFDMTGNVFEWMSNRYDPEKQGSMNQALRGGSFVLDGMYQRNSFRMRQSPSVMTDDIGFRVLREAIQKEEK